MPGVGRGELGPVLNEPGRRRCGHAGGGIGLAGRPGRPGFVGLAHIARPRLETRSRCPAVISARHLSEPNRLTSLVSRTSETSVPTAACPDGEPHDLAGVAGSDQDRPIGLDEQGKDLAAIELGDRRGHFSCDREFRRAGPRARCRREGDCRPRRARARAP